MIGPVGVGATVEELDIVVPEIIVELDIVVLEIESVAEPVTVGTAEEADASEALY